MIAQPGSTAQPVLVVEDDRALRHTLVLYLHVYGYLVRAAPDGESALRQLYTSAQPLVVVADLWSPALDGIECMSMALVRAVAHRRTLAMRHTYILLSTPAERTLPSHVTTVLAHTHAPLLARPIDVQKLMQVVHGARQRLERAA